MHTEICDKLDIEFPIFAFTHCRDVVAAVSNAGGFGVLGAIGFSPEELEIELDWLDDHVGEHGYGVDIVIPGKYEGMGELDPVKLETQLQSMVPEDHRRFARRLLDEHGCPPPPEDERRSGMMGWTEATAKPLLECALKHPKVRLIANALGTPPADVISQVHDHGLLFAALAGSVKHARHHADAGIDVVICQGTEGGGHTGEIGSLVLWPEVIDAIAPTPVLAAGGIGDGRQIAAALAMGAQGVWSGTLWLTVEEADTAPGQMKSYLAAIERRHHPVAFLHREALPDASKRLDRRLGTRRHPRPSADADADARGHRGRRCREALPGAVRRDRVQPVWADHRAGDSGSKGTRRRARTGRAIRRGGRPAD